MLLTVAWELSWYQFVVDLSDGREPVQVRGQGQELDELPEQARQWNLEAAEDGATARDRGDAEPPKKLLSGARWRTRLEESA